MPKRIVIIEGPDNIGKTTLCNALAEKFNMSRYHLGAPKRKGADALKEQLQTLNDVMVRINQGHEVEIWDRSVIGEAVYGPLFREYDHDAYWHSLVGRLKKYQTKMLFIVMYADERTYASWRIKPKSDEIKKYQRMELSKPISIRFIDVATRLHIPQTVYVNCNNYESMDQRNEYVTRRVNRFLANEPFTYSKTNDYTRTFFNYTDRIWNIGKGFSSHRYVCGQFDEIECSIGRDHAKLKMIDGTNARPIGPVGAVTGIRYIFVGESTGYNADDDQLGVPFYNGKSGCIFQEGLDYCGIHPTEYYLTNVVKCNPKDNKLANYVNCQNRKNLECVSALSNELRSIVQANAPVNTKIIAIGKVADEELTRLNIEHSVVYHPSYYNRMGESWKFQADLRAILKP